MSVLGGERNRSCELMMLLVYIFVGSRMVKHAMEYVEEHLPCNEAQDEMASEFLPRGEEGINPSFEVTVPE